ncbi:MAG: helix-turn-helix transcriptional regulator [Sporolactobacillus sp.]
MITCNLSVLLAERNLKISTLSKYTGISRTTLTALSSNRSKGIQFDTFDTLCTYLKVRPDDLFIQERFDYEFTIVKSDLHTNSHPLNKINLEFIGNDDGIVLATKFDVIYKERAFNPIIGLKILLPPNYIGDEHFLKIDISEEYFSSGLYDILSKIPISFKTAFLDELKETIKAYLPVLLDYKRLMMNIEDVESCHIDLVI